LVSFFSIVMHLVFQPLKTGPLELNLII